MIGWVLGFVGAILLWLPIFGFYKRISRLVDFFPTGPVVRRKGAAMETRLVVFKDKKIRRTPHNDDWWFSVVDVCGALTESSDAGAFWRKLKQRLSGEGSEVVTFCHGLKLMAPDGKRHATDCANTERLFPIIQSIPFNGTPCRAAHAG